MNLCPCGSFDGPTWDHEPDCSRYPGTEWQRDQAARSTLSTAPVEEVQRLTVEELADIAEDEQHRHDQRALAARALRDLARAGWVRTRYYEDFRPVGYSWMHPDHREEVVFYPRYLGDPVLYVGRTQHELEDVRTAVDLLVALGLLPAKFSSAYTVGHLDGIADGMEHVTELSIEARFDAYVDETWEKLHEPDTLAWIGRELDGLLDKVPFVRRRQVNRVIEVVLNAAGVGDE